MTLTGPAERLGNELEATRKVRIPLPELLSCWSAACPELAGSTLQLHDLSVALTSLASEGLLQLPADRSWDRTTRPALPNFVTVATNKRQTRPTPWRTFAWRPELGWAGSIPTMPDGTFESLKAVNRWLGTNRGYEIVPMRVRSAEIFGDEKRLDALDGSALFGPGRLSFDLLRCRRYPPPLVATRVSSGTAALVVENSDAYWMAVHAADATAGPVGLVVWGAGGGILQSLTALGEQPDPVERILYWGDLDPEGISIPARAATIATLAGLPAVEPATALWAALAACTPQTRTSVDWGSANGDWLGMDLWSATEPVRVAGGRVAQEQVNPAQVADAIASL